MKVKIIWKFTHTFVTDIDVLTIHVYMNILDKRKTSGGGKDYWEGPQMIEDDRRRGRG
jgi:hypothetical protein